MPEACRTPRKQPQIIVPPPANNLNPPSILFTSPKGASDLAQGAARHEQALGYLRTTGLANPAHRNTPPVPSSVCIAPRHASDPQAPIALTSHSLPQKLPIRLITLSTPTPLRPTIVNHRQLPPRSLTPRSTTPPQTPSARTAHSQTPSAAAASKSTTRSRPPPPHTASASGSSSATSD